MPAKRTSIKQTQMKQSQLVKDHKQLVKDHKQLVKDYKKAAKKLREIAALETKPSHALTEEETAKIQKRSQFTAVVKEFTKTTFDDLPTDVTNIILSYLPPFVRLVYLRHRHPTQYITNKIRRNAVTPYNMVEYIKLVRPLIDTFLNTNQYINTFMDHFCYYAGFIRRGDANQDIINYVLSAGKHILIEVVDNYMKMYKKHHHDLKKHYAKFEAIVFKLYSDILINKLPI
jgi:hypothetical protein